MHAQPRRRCASLPCSPVTGFSPLPPGQLGACEPPPLELEPAALEDGDREQADRTPCQFAPLMQMRRAQVLEANTAVATQSQSSPRGVAATAEDRVHDALDAMDALLEARQSADVLGWCLAGEGSAPAEVLDLPLDSVGSTRLRPSRRQSREASGEAVPELELVGLDDCAFRRGRGNSASSKSTSQNTLLPPPCESCAPRSVAAAVAGAALSAAAEAAASVAEALLGGAVESSTSCIEGLLCVDGDVALDAALLRETLQVVLLRLLEPLAQVERLSLTIPHDGASGFCATLNDGARGMRAFAYQVCVADPHDVEPMRETLLLEAESGGARRLLPLLAEQLCEDGLPTPRHLKVRLEVRGTC